MDRAADGLQASGEALTAIYNAAAKTLPEALVRVDRALDLAERGVQALERMAPPVCRCGYIGGSRFCPDCGGRDG